CRRVPVVEVGRRQPAYLAAQERAPGQASGEGAGGVYRFGDVDWRRAPVEQRDQGRGGTQDVEHHADALRRARQVSGKKDDLESQRSTSPTVIRRSSPVGRRS